MDCLFCEGMPKDYKPAKGIDYICSGCVLLLADANQDDLKRACVKAESKGLENKASALKSFIIEDEINERKTKNSKRDMERKRTMRKVRPSRNQDRT
jgi:hypothetical protein